jgi:hypothetical protein
MPGFGWLREKPAIKFVIPKAPQARWVPHFSRSLREVGLFAVTPQPHPALLRIFSSHQVQSLIRTSPASP